MLNSTELSVIKAILENTELGYVLIESTPGTREFTRREEKITDPGYNLSQYGPNTDTLCLNGTTALKMVFDKLSVAWRDAEDIHCAE